MKKIYYLYFYTFPLIATLIKNLYMKIMIFWNF